ncbi:MAG: DEAD/DEAH box helicase, partial [Cyanobacteria bacterium]|nr:DEAD/DEAH box helicase [Cyanobacteriota bacterium]
MERLVSHSRTQQGKNVSSGNTTSPIPQERRFLGGNGTEVDGQRTSSSFGTRGGDVFFAGSVPLNPTGTGFVLGNTGKFSGKLSGNKIPFSGHPEESSLHFSGFFQTGVKKKVQSLIRQRELQSLQPIIKNINALEPSVQALSDAQLIQKTSEFKTKLATKLGKPLDAIDFVKDATVVQAALNEILPEAFAVVREASVRVMKMRPFDVQMMAGVALHQNKVIEMKTGEGKTLTSVMPIYLNALLGKGVHVVTANDYLAKRDAEEMGQVFNFLGLSVGVTLAQQPKEEKRKAYQADITYGTNSEFGFDYLRDHLTARTSEEKAQRGFFFAIVDEADSILIDEARTPLIISGSSQASNDDIGMYQKFAKVVAELVKDRDYELDEKKKLVKLTEEGIDRAELMMGEKLGEPTSGTLFALNQSLRAKEFYHLNIDYLIQNGEVMIVDEFTGRVSQGRRWSEGLHLAIECKEQLAGHPVKIQGEHETDASVTYQNFFRLYPKLAGMTGTAITEAEEFLEVYGLPALDIPTNKPYIQKREPDVFTNSLEKKFKAVAEDIAQVHQTKRPILVGTGSIEDSETLSQLLT